MLSSVTSYFSKSKREGYSKISDAHIPKIKFFSNVPQETLLIIFSHLNIPDLIHINQTDKRFKQITDSNALYNIFIDRLNICGSLKEHVLLKNTVFDYYTNLRHLAKKEKRYKATKQYLKETEYKNSPTVDNIINLSNSLQLVDRWKLCDYVSIYTTNLPPPLNNKDYEGKSEQYARWILHNALDFNEIRVINCHKFDLSSYPPEIALFPSLTALFLSHNHLQEVPEELGLLTGLTHINLSQNHLKKLPEAITKLANLSFLEISNNKLETLPAISKLTKLQTLIFSNNHLDEFPKKLHHLTNLDLLAISNNFFKEIPVKILYLPFLQKLFIDQNQLNMQIFESIPEKLKLEISKTNKNS